MVDAENVYTTVKARIIADIVDVSTYRVINHGRYLKNTGYSEICEFFAKK